MTFRMEGFMKNSKIALVIAFLMIFGSAAYSATVISSHHRFDETTGTTADDSAGSNTGTLHNGPTWTTGHIANALNFDGYDDYVKIDNNITENFSITFWIKTSTPGIQGTHWWEGNGIVDAEMPSGQNDFGISLVGTKVCFGIGAPNGWYPYHADVSIKSVVNITDGQWHHVAATRNNADGKITLYIDGIHQTEAIGSTGIKNASPIITIGRLQTAATGQSFKGTIDDLHIFKSVLTQPEIQQYCNPVVTTDSWTNITATSVQLKGNLAFMGVKDSLSVGFKYGTNQNNLNLQTTTIVKNTIGQFSLNATNLAGNQVYYYRAFAQYGPQIYYGPVKSFRKPHWTGLGNPTSPFLITTPQELEALHTATDFYNTWFKVANDIDMSGRTFNTSLIAPDLNNSNGFTFDGPRFTGNFNGNNCLISNLLIDTNDAKKDNLGFFGFLQGTATNIVLENLTIESGSSQFNTGGIAGQSVKPIYNCFVSGSISTGANCYYVGGIVGCQLGTYISTCSADIQINADGEHIGGIAGSTNNHIYNCYSRGQIKLIGASSKVGGLVGLNLLSNIRNSYSKVDIIAASGTSYRLGGLVGEVNNRCSIANSYASGAISGNCQKAGGFIGLVYSDNSIQNCYSTGKVTGSRDIGGFIGSHYSNNTYTGCFFDTQTSTRPSSIGATGLTTAQMMTPSTFTDTNWNFTETNGYPPIWKFIHENEDYPRLDYQPEYAGDYKGLYGVNYIDFAHLAKWWGHNDCSEENNFCEGLDPTQDGFVPTELIWDIIDNWLVEFE